MKYGLSFAPLLALLLLAAAPRLAHAQTGGVGIGTTAPAASAALDVSSTSKGLLPPRMTQAQRNAIASPAAGLVVFNTSTNTTDLWDGSQWVAYLTDAQRLPATTFAYTGGAQTYTVPAGITYLRLDLAGAGCLGGLNPAGQPLPGSRGGRVQALLPVVAGQVFTVVVGGMGGAGGRYSTNPRGSGTGGYGGGGAGGYGSQFASGNGRGDGGGGASDLRLNGSTLADRVVVAGGGGGTGMDYQDYPGGTGGDGGGLQADRGFGGASNISGALGGGGGTQFAAGAGSVEPSGFYTAYSGNDGALGQGGQGAGQVLSPVELGGGGGGGGGWYGGGGGGARYYNYSRYSYIGGGGGGGSSYTVPTALNVVHSVGYQNGNGYVTITPATGISEGLIGFAGPVGQAGTGAVAAGPGLSAVLSNGLTTIGLGGSALAAPTTIDQAGHAFSLIGGNVGIGTSGPGHALTVQTNGTGQLLGFTNSQGTDKYNFTLAYAGLYAGLPVNGGLNLSESNVAEGRLFVQDGTGNVGIGTTRPGQKLDVAGNASVSGSTAVGGNATVAGNATVSGSVGIGISTTGQKLDVAGGILARGNNAIGQQGAYLQWNRSGGSETWLLNQPGGGSGGIRFGSATTGNVATEWARFDASGNLGLGTPTPSQKLDVAGNATVSGSTYVGGSLALRSGTTEKYNWSLTNGGLNLSESNVASGRLFVQDGGNVGIGTTNPSARLDVQGTGDVGNNNFAFFRNFNNSANSGYVTNNANDVSIRASGPVMAAEFYATSDRRLKAVVGRSDNAADLALLQRLRITDYTMRDRVQFGGRPFKKVIAQEVEAVLPQAVTRQTGFLPDVYAPATAAQALPGDSLLLLTLPAGLPEGGARAGQRLKLLGDTRTVLATVARPAAAGSRTLTVRRAQVLAGGAVFVYGLEHADVRAVDYEALSMLNVSATQELARQVATLQAQNAALKTQAATDKAQATATLETFEARLRRLEAAGAQASK